MKSNKILTITALTLALLITGCSEEDVTGNARDTRSPQLSTNEPLGNMKSVSRNTAVIIKFNELMDPTSINNSTFYLTQGSIVVSGELVYSERTATFTPANPLAALTVYTVIVTTGAKDLANNTIAHNLIWNFTTGGSTSPLPTVDLGESGAFVILAKRAIRNASTSNITGDVGLSPAATSYVTGLSVTNGAGYATSAQVTGRIYAADMATPTPVNLTTAIDNMITAYEDAENRFYPDFIELSAGNIGGKTLVPGLYKWTTNVTVPTNLKITGSADDVWIFQVAGNLSVSPAVTITLSGGAQAKNIFWQVKGETIIGTTAHVEGTILSMTGITLQTGASINGRALAQTTVILDSNAISNL